LREGDVVIERTAGGGGYGDPAARDVEAVARDVRAGFVTAAEAAAAYGVAIRDGRVDARATAALRERLRTHRLALRVRLDNQDSARLTLRVAPSSAQRAGLRDGDLAEIVRGDGPALLGWIRFDEAVADGECAMSAAAGAAPCEGRIELRRVRERT